ncbi:MAG TPA: class I SAM-dependent methyltransferase, partial [Chthoniobacterales bacterium]
MSEQSPPERESGIRNFLVEKLLGRFRDLPISFELRALDGVMWRCGADAPAFCIAVRNRRGLLALLSSDENRIAEAYLAGSLDLEGDWLQALNIRRGLSDFHPFSRAGRFLCSALLGQVRTNPRAIHSHYDLDPDFFLSFLNARTRCYTQGIFLRDDEDLSEATLRKLEFCVQACGLKAGDRVLEVGPGWGAFAEYAARRGIRVTGVMNSVESKKYLEELGRELGLSWELVLADILNFKSEQRFDAIVLMGIMEHLPDYDRIVRKFRELLRPGGFVYLDASATRMKFDAPSFITRHIFPGNHSFLILDDFLRALAATPMSLKGVYDDRHSYFLTVRQWARNLEAARERIVARYGEWNFRRFNLYLWSSAHALLTDTLQCYRLVLQ